jgi:minor curlin subunit
MKSARLPMRTSKLALCAALGAVVSLAVYAADLSSVSDFGPPEPGFGGSTQVAHVSQQGQGNRLNAIQAGQNGLMANQMGIANAAATAQVGNDNWTVLQQSGAANLYTGYQAGQYNRSIAVQNGSGNEATVTQIGNSMSSQVTQLGNNNEISILQSRNGSGLSVTQTGGARAAVLMK